ncbi:MAG TPA: nuclear transport factor 2 family protein [Acidimicrobiia bacterium]
MTDETRRVVTRMYDAAVGGDMAGFFACIDPEVVTHEPPFLPYGGSYLGIGALMDLLARDVSKHLDITQPKIDRIVVDGDRAFSVIRLRCQATGDETLLAEEAVVRRGKVVELRVFYFDAGSLIEQGDRA